MIQKTWLEDDDAEYKRWDSFFDWYKSKVLFPIYKDSHNFNQGVSRQYWGNIRYHGPISAFKWEDSIYFYLHAKDQQKEFAMMYLCVHMIKNLTQSRLGYIHATLLRQILTALEFSIIALIILIR